MKKYLLLLSLFITVSACNNDVEEYNEITNEMLKEATFGVDPEYIFIASSVITGESMVDPTRYPDFVHYQYEFPTQGCKFRFMLEGLDESYQRNITISELGEIVDLRILGIQIVDELSKDYTSNPLSEYQDRFNKGDNIWMTINHKGEVTIHGHITDKEKEYNDWRRSYHQDNTEDHKDFMLVKFNNEYYAARFKNRRLI